MEEVVEEAVEKAPMSCRLYKASTMMEVFFLKQDASRLLRNVSTPRTPQPEYVRIMLKEIEKTVARMRADLYAYERAQGQGPREASPTSPAEDDPA